MKPLLITAALLWAHTSFAHEFWMMPDRFSPAAREPVEVALRVGEHFVGDPVGFGRPIAEALRVFGADTEQLLTPLLPADLGQDRVALAFEKPGTQMIALDTQAFSVTLAPDTFNAYLREEGLDHVLAQRQARPADASPVRERYRRHVKTLLRVGGRSDDTHRRTIGQTLEIVPIGNPLALAPGQALSMQVLFEGRPLGQALLKAWHQRGGQLTVLRTRTDTRGQASLALPWRGVWMVSVVHMVPSTDPGRFDWDSHWGNLTFETAPPARPRGPGRPAR